MSTHSRIKTRLVASVFVATALLVGCSGGGSSGADKSTTTEAGASSQADATTKPAGTKPTGNGSSADPKENGAAAAGIDLKNPPKPIGEVTVPINEDGITGTKVEVLEVKPRDNVLLVTLRFTPEGTTSDRVTIFQAMGQHSLRLELIDLKNLKRYEAVQALTSDSVGGKTEMGGSLYGFTAFPLPPDDVKTMDLKVSDLAPSIEDLPLQ